MTASGPSRDPHPAYQAASKRTVLADTLLTRAREGSVGRPLETVLTVREVAARLRISTATVYSLCRRGELEHHRVSHAIRVFEREVARYLTRPAIDDS